MSLSPQSLSPNLPPDTQREMLRRMVTIRQFEERASADYLAGKIYGTPRFGLDIVFGGHLLGEATPVTGEDYLGFAGIAPPELHLVPTETHLAEKLHAYTLPRTSPNSRVRASAPNKWSRFARSRTMRPSGPTSGLPRP